jgi:hypothetical protein
MKKIDFTQQIQELDQIINGNKLDEIEKQHLIELKEKLLSNNTTKSAIETKIIEIFKLLIMSIKLSDDLLDILKNIIEHFSN